MKNILVSFLMILPVISGFKSIEKSGKLSEMVIKTSVVCEMCKERIEKNLVFEKGVKEVIVDVDKKTITVKYREDKTTPEKIRKAVSELGYRADDITANEKAFDSLPKCCKEEGCGK